MRNLKICLWVVGIACLIPMITLFLPMSSYSSLSRLFVEVQVPEHRLFAYAIRVGSATSVLAGIFYIILALQPRRYGLMLPFAGVAPLSLGITFAVAGVAEGISFWAYGGDAVLAILMGSFILYFWRVEKPSQREEGPQETPQDEDETT